MAKVYLAYSLMGRLSLFFASAVGTVLATIGTNTKYVAVTVAVSTAVSRWLFSTMVEEQRENYERAVSELTCAKLRWEALPNEQRSQQAMRDRLVLNVERFIEACLPPQTSMLRVKDEAPQSEPADIGVTTKSIAMELSPTEKASSTGDALSFKQLAEGADLVKEMPEELKLLFCPKLVTVQEHLGGLPLEDIKQFLKQIGATITKVNDTEHCIVNATNYRYLCRMVAIAHEVAIAKEGDINEEGGGSRVANA